MILRKLAHAIKEQSWFTVVLEVLIVVVGIFIGLQVDGWNEVRKDHVREIKYLKRIESELVQDIVDFEEGVVLAAQRREYVQLILTALDDAETVQRAPTEFVRALVWAGLTYSPVVSHHTFEEIKSAGELHIIGDVELRVAITEYYQQVRQYGQWNYLRELNQTEYLKRQAGILTALQFRAFWVNGSTFSVSEEDALDAYEKMLNKTEFIEWLPITLAFLDQNGNHFGTSKENAEKLRGKIAAYLGNKSTGSGQ